MTVLMGKRSLGTPAADDRQALCSTGTRRLAARSLRSKSALIYLSTSGAPSDLLHFFFDMTPG